MARKIQPEHFASEFWVVESVEAGRYHANVTLRDLYCWVPSDDDDDEADLPNVVPGTRGAECIEHTEHSITFPTSPQTKLRPGMQVRITVEQVA